eukprot:2210124-Rhodomonas_salina.1
MHPVHDAPRAAVRGSSQHACTDTVRSLSVSGTDSSCSYRANLFNKGTETCTEINGREQVPQCSAQHGADSKLRDLRKYLCPCDTWVLRLLLLSGWFVDTVGQRGQRSSSNRITRILETAFLVQIVLKMRFLVLNFGVESSAGAATCHWQHSPSQWPGTQECQPLCL